MTEEEASMKMKLWEHLPNTIDGSLSTLLCRKRSLMLRGGTPLGLEHLPWTISMDTWTVVTEERHRALDKDHFYFNQGIYTNL